ncbi:MAG TPA: GntR family transcriptional regulator [Nitrospirota bacterium]|nr:GntR family transcriptional regulator [Nitrospirota bacterium]
MYASIPVYYQIRNTIKDWIVNKDYSYGDKIPSENELAELFKVTRLTVRQGISLLVQEGLLIRKRGEGTFVTADENLVRSLGLEFTGFMDDLFYEVSRTKTKSVIIEKITSTKSVKEKLDLANDDIIRIKRVRLLNNKIFAYTINYISPALGSQITEKELLKKPMLKIIEQDIGIEFEEALQTIEASFADPETAEKLEIAPGSPILFVERIMYAKNQKPIELVQTSYSGEHYKYVVRLKSDKSSKGRRWVQHIV